MKPNQQTIASHVEAVLTVQEQLNDAREKVLGTKTKLTEQEDAAAQCRSGLKSIEAQLVALTEQRQDAQAKLSLGQLTQEEAEAVVKESVSQRQQLAEVARTLRVEVAKADDTAAGLQRALTKVQADLTNLERETRQAAVDCIRQEAELEAAEYERGRSP